jgi:hypothetical protein
MAEKTKKPTLSDTAFRMLMRCGMQYFWRYIEGIRIPPGISMAIGTATDVSVTTDLTFKKNTGKLRIEDELKDIARDALNGTWTKGVRLVGDELKESQKKLKGEAVDDAVALSVLHHKEIAPTIEPVDLQRFWRLELENYPYDLAGRFDIEERDRLRDTKTTAKSPTWDEAHKSDQLTIYALAHKVTKGTVPTKLSLDYLIRTKVPKQVVLETQRTEEDFQAIFRLYEKSLKIIEAGAFMPSRDGWWCSDKWCGYWADKCQFGRRSQIKSFPSVKPEPEAKAPAKKKEAKK